MATDREKDVIRRIMTDQELICEFMEPKPVGSWMREIQPTWWYYSTYDLPIGWHVKDLTLDALWEVEERLTGDQWKEYRRQFRVAAPPRESHEEHLIHLSAAQKIKALAAVMRNGETQDGE